MDFFMVYVTPNYLQSRCRAERVVMGFVGDIFTQIYVEFDGLLGW